MNCDKEINRWKELVEDHLFQQIQILEEVFTSMEKEIRLANKTARKEGYRIPVPLPEVRFNQFSDGNLQEVHGELLNQILELAAELPVIITKEQSADRFSRLSVGRKGRLLKPLKRILFRISILPGKLSNKLRKREHKIPFWTHSIRIRALFQKHFSLGGLHLIIGLEKQLLENVRQTARSLRRSHEDVKATIGVSKEFDKVRNLIRNELELFIAAKSQQIALETELAGTIEYDNGTLNEVSLTNQFHRTSKEWKLNYDGYSNSIFAIFEDWRSDQEIHELTTSVSKLILQIQESYTNWADEIEKKHLASIRDFIEKQVEIFKSCPENEIGKIILQGRYQIRKQLNGALIQALTEYLSKNGLLIKLDQSMYVIDQEIEQLSDEHSILKSGDYDRRLFPKDFADISAYDLISFEMLPGLLRDMDAIKKELSDTVEISTTKLGDLDEILSYTLATAESTLTDEGSDAKKIILAGFGRGLNKLDESKENLTQRVHEHSTQITERLTSFSEELTSLTENENVTEIQFRISKAKALQKSAALKKKAFDRIRSKWAELSKVATGRFFWIREIAENWRRKIIPPKALEEQARTMSEFILEANATISELPLTYRRLYAIEPLMDQMMFEGRSAEITDIQKALESWKNGKFSAVLLRGEKWSGMTSLINQLPAALKFNLPVVRPAKTGKVVEEEELIRIFSEVLKAPFSTLPELIEHLNNGPRRILIMENLQNLYLKRIDGKKALKAMLRLISSTQKNVFWICSISTYAFAYLEKTVRMSGFFSYVITLRDLSDHEIKEIILKRNRISGYHIKFEPDEKDVKSAKFMKLSEPEQQEILAKQYFRELNSFARSNISMALIFWLLSTRDIDQNEIKVDSFKNPDFSYLMQLTMEKVHLLHALILHDGLTTEHLSLILVESKSNIEMLVLELIEDGLIFEKGDLLYVNTIVYRSIIQLLKSKNLIY